MGCDIHAHWEVKISGKWHHYDQPRIDRNYVLFAKMANVRNRDDEIEPLSIPKGLPEDITEIVKICRDYYGEDGHSDSWLGVDEIYWLESFFAKHCSEDQYKTRWWKEFGFLFGSGWEYFKKYPKDYPESLEDFRLIFWFDN